MNAYEIPGMRFSLPAAENISRRRFIVVDTDGAGRHATAGVKVVGVSANEALAGEVVEVSDGIVGVEASAAIEAGASVSVASLGKAVTATAASQLAVSPFTVTPGSIVVGTALTNATDANQLITVKIF